jgi:hypothetical protein
MGVGSLLGDKPAGTGWSALGYTGAEQPSGSVSSRKETGRYVQLAAWQDNKEGQAKNDKPAENGLPPRPGSTSIERDNSKLKEDLDNEMGRSSDLPNFQSLSKEEFENVIKTSVQNGSVTTREIGRTITTRVYAVPFSTGNGLYYALLEHQSIESFDPEVRGPRTTIDRYRLALVVPEGYDLKTAIDLVLAPQAMVNAEKVEGTPEFALHMVPFGAAADYTCQGDLPNAGWSVAGDIAGVLTFGAGKVLRVSSKSYELSKRGLVGGLALEGSIGIYRTGEGTYLLSQGEGGQGEIAEGLLRLFGVSASLMRRKGSAALDKILSETPNRERLDVSKYDTLNLGSGGEFPNGQNVLHVNIEGADLPPTISGGRLIHDATKLHEILPSNHFLQVQSNHIPGELQIARGIIEEGFCALKPGGTGTFSSSTLRNVKELMEQAGFRNVEVVGLARRTIYQGRVTMPALEYRGVKPN